MLRWAEINNKQHWINNNKTTESRFIFCWVPRDGVSGIEISTMENFFDGFFRRFFSIRSKQQIGLKQFGGKIFVVVIWRNFSSFSNEIGIFWKVLVALNFIWMNANNYSEFRFRFLFRIFFRFFSLPSTPKRVIQSNFQTILIQYFRVLCALHDVLYMLRPHMVSNFIFICMFFLKKCIFLVEFVWECLRHKNSVPLTAHGQCMGELYMFIYFLWFSCLTAFCK